MEQQLPLYIPLLFSMTVLITLFLFYQVLVRSSGFHNKAKAGRIMAGILLWLIVQALLAMDNFYALHLMDMPPRVPLLILPPLLVVLLMVFTRQGKKFTLTLPLFHLTLLHTVRVFVEGVLFALASYGVIPIMLTWEGSNWDILTGLSAPFIAYYVFKKKTLNPQVLFLWNIAGLALLLNVVIKGVLSVPTPFQQLNFETPNLAMMYFPYNWLPCFIVPLMLYAHLAAFLKLRQKTTEQ